MPASSRRISAKDATSSSIPPLLIGKHHTTSSALHNLGYKGPLRRWSNFLRAVETDSKTRNWSRRVIKYNERLDEEVVEVGDEHGVQGRFQQSIGTVLGHVFRAQSIDLTFADFKTLGSSYYGTPDVIIKSSNNELKVVGELKAPWIEDHRLRDFGPKDADLRRLLAQPILYMRDLQCMYGFLSTYEQTIFLRQELVSGRWEVEYSPVMRGSADYVPSDPGDTSGTPAVSLKQCFLYVAGLASVQGPVSNTTPRSQWFSV